MPLCPGVTVCAAPEAGVSANKLRPCALSPAALANRVRVNLPTCVAVVGELEVVALTVPSAPTETEMASAGKVICGLTK